MVKIYSNELNNIILRNFNHTTYNLNTSLERLSTGYKINHAKDDAASSAVVSKMAVKLSATEVAENNINIGLSYLSTAESTLDCMKDNIDRIRDLSVRAANGVYSRDQINAIQEEINQRLEEVIRLQDTTEYNGINIFCETYNLDGTKTYVTNLINGIDEVPPPVTTSYTAMASTIRAPIPEDYGGGTNKASPIDITIEETNLTDAKLMTASAFGVSRTTTQTITVGGNSYDISDGCTYTYDAATGTVTFLGEDAVVTAHGNQANKVIFNCKNGVYNGTTGTNTITVRGEGAQINGSSGKDTVTINADNVTLAIGEGDNEVTIMANKAAITGGNGNNTIIANTTGSQDFARDSSLTLGNGNNTINSMGYNSTITVGDGDNDISLKKSNEKLYLGNGTNTVTSSGRVNSIYCSGGDDTITVTSDSSNIYTGSGKADITLTGWANNTTIIGGNGQDNIHVNTSDNYIKVGSGVTTIDIPATSTQAGQTTNNNNIDGSNNPNLTINNHNTTTGFTNCIGYPEKLTDSGYLMMNQGESRDVTIGDKTYNLKATHPSAGTRFSWSLDSATGIITMNSSARFFEITAATGQNDKLNVTIDNAVINTGDGDDYIKSSGADSVINDTTGNNTIECSGARTKLNLGDGDNIINSNCNSSIINVGNGQNNINLKGYAETLIAGDGGNTVTVSNGDSKITTGSGADTILVNGYKGTINAGDGDDNIVVNGYHNIVHGDGGADTITMNAADNNLYGDEGNDKFIVNAANNEDYHIDGGSGNDTFDVYANALYLHGNDGNDNFHIHTRVNGVLVDGGNGTDTLTDEGTDTRTYSIEGYSEPLPADHGEIYFNFNESKTLNIGDKIYKITKGSKDNQYLKYSTNAAGVITFECSTFTIEAVAGQKDNLNIKGYFNNIDTGDMDDTVHISSGFDNSIVTGDGNDTVTMNTNNNHIKTGNGNDTIIMNSINEWTTSKVDSGEGNNTIIINGNNNKGAIETGNGNNNIIINGNNNSNIITGSGKDRYTVNGNNNSFNAGGNDDDIYNSGEHNLINGGSGTDTVYETRNTSEYTNIDRIGLIHHDGEFNIKAGESFDFIFGDAIYNITSDKDTSFKYSYTNHSVDIRGDELKIEAVGNPEHSLVVVGNKNNISSGDASNNVTVKGDENTLHCGDGSNTVNVIGSNNKAYAGGGNDLITVSDGRDNYVDGGAGIDVLMNSAIHTTFTGIETIYKEKNDTMLQVGITSSKNSVLSVNTGFLLTNRFIDVSTTGNARNAIDTCDTILAQISSKITMLGAAQNRLESALDANTIRFDALTESSSTIKDLDISAESSNFIKNQILQNASQSLMTQANQIHRENVLRLLPQ